MVAIRLVAVASRKLAVAGLGPASKLFGRSLRSFWVSVWFFPHPWAFESASGPGRSNRCKGKKPIGSKNWLLFSNYTTFWPDFYPDSYTEIWLRFKFSVIHRILLFFIGATYPPFSNMVEGLSISPGILNRTEPLEKNLPVVADQPFFG